MITEKSVNIQIIGALMKNPLLLSDTKYTITPEDFSTSFERQIFGAIYNLFLNGVETISVVDIDNYLQNYEGVYQNFIKANGIEYLQDCEEISNELNFDYYYNKLKKYNLLNDLKTDGFDISNLYPQDIMDKDYNKKMDSFEEMSTKDIFDKVKLKLSGLEAKYECKGDIKKIKASDGIRELLENLEANPDVGAPLQGKIYNTAVRGARLGKYYIRSADSGVGKCVPNSTKIPTPKGYTTVGQVKVGDYLFDAFGKPTKVLAVYPQGEKEVWEVTFKDGRKALCCEDHLWSYCTEGQRKEAKEGRKFYTDTLKELSKKELYQQGHGYKILVPMQKAVQYSEKQYTIDPYVLGLFLGDGSFRYSDNHKALMFSSSDVELVNYISNIMNWNSKQYQNHSQYSWYFEFKNNSREHKNVWVEDFLKSYPELLNVRSENKFIPLEYLQGSIEQRFELLNGLLDTDGSIDKEKGRISYCTISSKLRDNIIELARSLGFKTSVIEDSHKDTNICYNIEIFGQPKDKIKLFKLNRKKELILQWYNNGKRKENNLFNPIIEIKKLDYSEEMTCFYVDNEEHLFLMNDFIVTHNTRSMIGDACGLAYPFRFNQEDMRWEYNGCCEKVLYLGTEQEPEEIQTIILAYLTGINEERILCPFAWSNEERQIINKALELMDKFSDNFVIDQMPDPSIKSVKAKIRQEVLVGGFNYVFYDYIFSSPALMGELGGLKLREDVILMMMSTALKDLAVELNIFLQSATQVTVNEAERDKMKTKASIRGAKSIADKADVGVIISLVTENDLKVLAEAIDLIGETPNQVTDIYKLRRGKYNNVRIWSKYDAGTCRKKDLFITDSRMNQVTGFQSLDIQLDLENIGELDKILNKLNNFEEQEELKQIDNNIIVNTNTGEVIEENKDNIVEKESKEEPNKKQTIDWSKLY